VRKLWTQLLCYFLWYTLHQNFTHSTMATSEEVNFPTTTSSCPYCDKPFKRVSNLLPHCKERKGRDSSQFLASKTLRKKASKPGKKTICPTCHKAFLRLSTHLRSSATSVSHYIPSCHKHLNNWVSTTIPAPPIPFTCHSKCHTSGVSSWSILASYPGLQSGGRPGTHCLRMRVIFTNFRWK